MRLSLVPMSLALLLLAAFPAFSVLAAPDNTCVFTLGMTSGVDVNNLDFTVDYTATGGSIDGTANFPECTRAFGGQGLAGFHDNDETSILNVGVLRLSYFSAPISLAGCRIFYDSQPPDAGQFTIKITNAGRDGGDDNVVPKPTVVVTSVECPGQLPEGTTTTTTMGSGEDRCGFPVSNGAKPAASDALFVLKAAVGSAECDLCVCDINGSGGVAAGDALTTLKAAVGIQVSYDCPPC